MSLTEEFMKMSHENTSIGGGYNDVKGVYDLIQSGMVKEASQRMSVLNDSDIVSLNKMLSDTTKVAGKAAKSNVSGSAVPIASAGNRTIRGEGNAATSAGATDTSTLKQPTAGGTAKNNQGGAANSPDIGAMLDTPINEILRTPDGSSSQDDLKKKAEFIENFKLGIADGEAKIAALVAEKGKLNMMETYGEPFAKIASVYGNEVATEIILRAQADGIKEASLARINNQEVKMGSLDALYNEQSKVATVEDLGAYARELGRLSVMSKVAELQGIEGEVDGEEITEEDLGALEALVDQATEAPETLSDEEAELILELSQGEEEEETALVGEEKVTTVMDIVAALRHGGW